MGAWLAQPAHAERVAAEGATAATAVLNALSDDDVRDVIEDLAREHVLAPEWGPSIGGWLERVVESDAHTSAVALAADSLASWLAANQRSEERPVGKEGVSTCRSRCSPYP